MVPGDETAGLSFMPNKWDYNGNMEIGVLSSSANVQSLQKQSDRTFGRGGPLSDILHPYDVLSEEQSKERYN